MPHTQTQLIKKQERFRSDPPRYNYSLPGSTFNHTLRTVVSDCFKGTLWHFVRVLHALLNGGGSRVELLPGYGSLWPLITADARERGDFRTPSTARSRHTFGGARAREGEGTLEPSKGCKGRGRSKSQPRG